MPIIQQNSHFFMCDEKVNSPHLVNYIHPPFWQNADAILGKATGRGITYFLHTHALWGVNTVLRHYYRGGLWGKINRDIYLFTGLEYTRSIQEFRLLQLLHQAHIPVPKPILAHVECLPIGCYRANLITERIENAQDLVAILQKTALPACSWQQIGKLIAQLHHAQINHRDLNAHNILLQAYGTSKEKAYCIDFDKCGITQGEQWKKNNLARLKRSFLKEKQKRGIHFNDTHWQALLKGYQSPLCP